MVASQAAEIGEEVHDEGPAPEGGFHPWVLHMDRGGKGFNGNQRNHLFLGTGAAGFLDLSLVMGADSPLDGRALIAADFDRDGDDDLFVHNLQRVRHQLWRNDLGQEDASLTVALHDPMGHPEAVGAIVRVRHADGRQQARLVQRGSGFASCVAGPLVFAASGPLEVTVQWPGTREPASFGVHPPGARLRLVRGEGAQVLEEVSGQLSDPWATGLRLAVGKAIPELLLETEVGDPVRLAPPSGGALHFWSSGCAACVRGLAQAAARGDLMICVDPGLRRARSAQLLREAGFEEPALFAPFDPDRTRGSLGLLVDLMRLPVPTRLRVDEQGNLAGVSRVSD